MAIPDDTLRHCKSCGVTLIPGETITEYRYRRNESTCTKCKSKQQVQHRQFKRQLDSEVQLILGTSSPPPTPVTDALSSDEVAALEWSKFEDERMAKELHRKRQEYPDDLMERRRQRLALSRERDLLKRYSDAVQRAETNLEVYKVIELLEQHGLADQVNVNTFLRLAREAHKPVDLMSGRQHQPNH